MVDLHIVVIPPCARSALTSRASQASRPSFLYMIHVRHGGWLIEPITCRGNREIEISPHFRLQKRAAGKIGGAPRTFDVWATNSIQFAEIAAASKNVNRYLLLQPIER